MNYITNNNAKFMILNECERITSIFENTLTDTMGLHLNLNTKWRNYALFLYKCQEKKYIS
jgi:hypothetical protein